MTQRSKTTLAACALLAFGSGVFAGSLPDDRRDWKAVDTPLAEIGTLPGCDADVSALPPIYQKTVATYCGARPEGPGKVAVLASESAMEPYRARVGKFPDGAQTALHLIDMKVLMVTTYEDGAPVYQVFKENGDDMTAKEGPLSAATCNACHADSGACINGQCGEVQ